MRDTDFAHQPNSAGKCLQKLNFNFFSNLEILSLWNRHYSMLSFGDFLRFLIILKLLLDFFKTMLSECTSGHD